MEQTALEWFAQELYEKFEMKGDGYIFDQIFNRAKEMEANQRQQDTNHGYAQGYDDGAEGKEPMKPEVFNTKSE